MKLGRNAELEEKQNWSNEKSKLDNARRLRGIDLIDPEDKEFKETIRNARKTWKLPLCLARRARRTRMVKPEARLMISSQILCVSWKPVNPQDCVWENLYRNIMGTILQEKGAIHCNIRIWYTKFILMPQAMKIPAAKAAVDKEWEKLEKISTWNLTKVRSKKVVIADASTKGAKVHSASLMDICHLKNAELEAKHQKYKGRFVFRGYIVKDESGSCAVFAEQRSSASQMTAAKVMDIISRLPGCDGQAADAVSAETQVKMEDAPKLLKVPKSEWCKNDTAESFSELFHAAE